MRRKSAQLSKLGAIIRRIASLQSKSARGLNPSDIDVDKKDRKLSHVLYSLFHPYRIPQENFIL